MPEISPKTVNSAAEELHNLRGIRTEFDLPGFHAAVLDSGSVPMPVLTDIVAGWVDDRSAAQSR